MIDRRTTLIGGLATALPGCAMQISAPIVPVNLADEAMMSSKGFVRMWGDGGADEVAAFLKHEAPILRAKYQDRGKARKGEVSHILAISGGADDGAFSAGLMAGWGAKGDRPHFDVVTGVSAGSLVAPFVFLGSDYDKQLSTIFTTHSGAAIYTANPLAGVFGGPSLADNAPLAKLIEGYVDRTMIRRVAAERAKGRYLLICTTNLHAQRPVIWDMGRIAEAGSIDLFRSVLLASAALPGIFPPVEITVKAAGKTFSEIHVDGGPTREVFVSPAVFSFRDLDKEIGVKVSRRLWLIRNGKLTPEYANVSLSAASIAMRSLETLTKYQGLGDINRIYDHAKLDGMDFNLASIPPTFNERRPAPFDPGYMNALFKTAYELGRSGYQWAKVPPESNKRT